MKKLLDAEPIAFRHAAPENPWPTRIEKAAAAVFGGLLHCQIPPASRFSGRYGDLTAVINITGAVSGLLKVCCSFTAAQNIASRMLGVPQPSEEQIQYSLGEVAYRIARKMRGETTRLAAECLLSSPTTDSPENAEYDPLEESVLVVFDFQGFPIRLRLSLCS